MKQRQNRMKLHRKPSVWGGYEDTLARHAPDLAQELSLFTLLPDVFEHRTGVYVI